MINLKFIKCHGSGNDFILFDELSPDFTSSAIDYSLLAPLLCNRQLSIGADGLLILKSNAENEFIMRMFNPDGSEAQMCGNGIRCVARLASQYTQKGQFEICSGGRRYKITREDPVYASLPTYGVEIPISLHPGDLPFFCGQPEWIDTVIPELDPQIRFTALSLGNPHLVAHVPEMDPAKLKHLGEKVITLPHLFPEGVNVSFYQKQASQSIFVSTYERGAGITYSCGTAMTASSTAACLLQLCAFEKPIRVYNQGGMVNCICFSNHRLITRLIGNATFEYSGECQYDAGQQLLNYRKLEDYPNENEAYTAFIKAIQAKEV